MIHVFEFVDYRAFIRRLFLAMPNRGHGQARRLAIHLGVHSTLVSQVLKGGKSFTLEQASSAAEFLGLNDLETRYFLELVQLDRAGTESLRKNVKKHLESLRKEASSLARRLRSVGTLSEEKRAVFYSDWAYAAVRQATALPEMQSAEAIARHLDLSMRRTKEVLDFLLGTGLCVEERGRIKIGPSSTHLESSSPWVRTHHANWRQKAIQRLSAEEPAQLHYSCPMTLSKNDARKVREMLARLLEEVDKVIDPSPSEELRCLSIDWFRV